MFFLIRAAFWITVVLVLLPSGETKTPEAPKIDAFDALSAATSAVSDVSQFCTRKPEACETGAHAAAAFGQRAQAGARMVYDFLSERMETGSVDKDKREKSAEPQPAGTAKTQPAPKTQDAKVPRAAHSQSTLTPADLDPAHRGPKARGETAVASREKRG
ncbi:MAG: DUF5330 domain-containing protein [Pseudorhodoplanes sp.]